MMRIVCGDGARLELPIVPEVAEEGVDLAQDEDEDEDEVPEIPCAESAAPLADFLAGDVCGFGPNGVAKVAACYKGAARLGIRAFLMAAEQEAMFRLRLGLLTVAGLRAHFEGCPRVEALLDHFSDAVYTDAIEYERLVRRVCGSFLMARAPPDLDPIVNWAMADLVSRITALGRSIVNKRGFMWSREAIALMVERSDFFMVTSR